MIDCFQLPSKLTVLEKTRKDHEITLKPKILWMRSHSINHLLKDMRKASLSPILSEIHHHRCQRKVKAEAHIKLSRANIERNKVLCKQKNRNLSAIVKDPIA
jgi:hypothetical protein